MKTNKKAQTTLNTAYWLIRLGIFLPIVTLVVILIVNAYIQKEVPVLDVDAELLIHRIINSREGISYIDPLSNRLYPGIIDITRFKEQPRLEKSIFYGDTSTYIGAKLTLTNESGNTIAEIIYNNKAYRRIAERGLRGKGGVEVREKQLYVLARNKKGELQKATLHTEVVISRS